MNVSPFFVFPSSIPNIQFNQYLLHATRDQMMHPKPDGDGCRISVDEPAALLRRIFTALRVSVLLSIVAIISFTDPMMQRLLFGSVKPPDWLQLLLMLVAIPNLLALQFRNNADLNWRFWALILAHNVLTAATASVLYAFELELYQTFALLTTISILAYFRVIYSIAMLRQKAGLGTLSLGKRAGRPPKRYRLAANIQMYLPIVLAYFGAVLWIILIVSLPWERLDVGGSSMATTPLILASIVAPLGYIAQMKRRLNQRRALSLDEVRSTDSRRPVLYLRSFSSDGNAVLRLPSFFGQTNGGGRMLLECPATDLWYWGRTIRIEEVIATELWGVGPVVAIGDPNDNLPELGAARKYFTDSDWQEAVLSLMEDAEIIVIAAGDTPWVRWEVENALARGYLDKIVFLTPTANSARADRCWQALKTIAPALSLDAKEFSLSGQIRAIIFRRGKPIYLTSEVMDQADLVVCLRKVVQLKLSS